MTSENSPDDRGLLLGDGLFETVRVEHGAPVNLAAHLDRLVRGCAMIGLPAPGADLIEAAVAAAIADAGSGPAALRLTWSAGAGGRGLDRPMSASPRLTCGLSPAPVAGGGVSLATVTVRRNEGSPLSRVKSLSYLDNVLARREARARGADEALMLNNRGEVACAAAGNLFWLEGQILHTPALACGVLDGTVRAAVLARAPSLGLTVREVRAAPAALAGAEALVLTNSLTGVRQVRGLDRRELAPHRLAGALAAACADLIGDRGASDLAL